MIPFLVVLVPLIKLNFGPATLGGTQKYLEAPFGRAGALSAPQMGHPLALRAKGRASGAQKRVQSPFGRLTSRPDGTIWWWYHFLNRSEKWYHFWYHLEKHCGALFCRPSVRIFYCSAYPQLRAGGESRGPSRIEK